MPPTPPAEPGLPAGAGLGGTGRFASNLEGLRSEAATDEAAGRRAREAELRRQAAEESSFVGVLVDLGEQGRRVAVTVVSGRRHAGAVRSVGSDCCVLRTDSGTVALRLDAIDSVRHLPGESPVGGIRPTDARPALVDLLAELAADRSSATIVTMLGEPLRGEVRSVGTDVVTLRVESDPPTVAYVPTAAVAEVTPAITRDRAG